MQVGCMKLNYIQFIPDIFIMGKGDKSFPIMKVVIMIKFFNLKSLLKINRAIIKLTDNV